MYKSLLEHFAGEKEAVARAKLASVLGQLARQQGLEPTAVLEDLATLLRAETSHAVLAALLDALHHVGLQSAGDKRVQHKATQLARQVGCTYACVVIFALVQSNLVTSNSQRDTYHLYIGDNLI